MCEERGEPVAKPVVVQNRTGPPATGTEHVAKGESTTGNQPLVVVERIAPAREVAHVHVDRAETRTQEYGRHFVLAVDALLTEYRDPRFRHADVRRPDLLRRIKGQPHLQPGVVIVQQAVELLPGRRGVVSQRLYAIAGLRPGALHVSTRKLQNERIVTSHGQHRLVFDPPDRRRRDAVPVENHLHLRQLALRDLHDPRPALR